MLQFQCTQKISQIFGLKLQGLPDEPNETIFGVWYVNYFELFEIDFILFVNDPTLYAIPVHVPDQKKPYDLENQFKENLFYGLVADGINEYKVRKKLADYEPTIYTKTSSRKILGNMNDLKRNMYFYVEREIYEGGGVVDMLSIQQWLNRIPQRTIDWKYAVETMRESLRNG